MEGEAWQATSPWGHNESDTTGPLHFTYILLSCAVRFVASVVSHSLQRCGLQPAKLLCPWDSPARIIKLPHPPPGDFPNPGSNSPLLCLLHGRWVLHHQHYLGSPFDITNSKQMRLLNSMVTEENKFQQKQLLLIWDMCLNTVSIIPAILLLTPWSSTFFQVIQSLGKSLV